MAKAVPNQKVESKWFARPAASPAGCVSPGEKVWSPKLPLVKKSDSRSVCVPKPYPDASG